MSSFDFEALTKFLTSLFEAFKRLAIALGIIEEETAEETTAAAAE